MKPVIRFTKTFNQLSLLVLLMLVLLSSCVQKKLELEDGDWPQYKKDNYRSGVSSEELDLETQGEAWVHQASHRPAPAWYGPAKEDAYAKSGPLPSMRDYDLAFYPIVVGENLFYGSSADDALHCLDAESGDEKWLFTTDGPIRVAPTFHAGNLYFGSDDGFVYSINAANGKLNWKYSPSPKDHQKVLNNSRLISFWPIRTGILIEKGIAYFGASMLPWKKSYVCAVNIENGKDDIPGTYIKEYSDLTLEGAMASTGSMLVQPQGRISPIFFNKSSGEKGRQMAGTGGCFVLVTPDQNIVHGHTSRHNSIVESPVEKQPEFMTFKDGKEMVVKGDTSFVMNETSIAAYNRTSKKLLWFRWNYQAHRIVVAGNTLLAGGTDKVYGINPKNGLPLWTAEVEGTVYALVVANKAVYASTGEGKIYCFKGGQGNGSYYAENLNKEAGIDDAPKKESKQSNNSVLQLKAGPFIHALSADSALLEFETHEETKVNLSWETLGSKYEVSEGIEVWKHHIKLPIRKDFTYTYKIESNGKIAQFEYDNFFNYHKRSNTVNKFPMVDETVLDEVNLFLDNYPLQKGICLNLGNDSEQRGIAIATNTELNVIKAESSEKEADKLRSKLHTANIYGQRISVLKSKSTNNLPIISELFDLVWVTEADKFEADEVIRLIAPNKYAYISGVTDFHQWIQKSSLDWQVKVEKIGVNNYVLIKNPIENAGSWTDQYGKADNSSFGGESLWGSTSTEEFEVQWMGRPGPRFQTDRSGRKPSPLAVSGKLFVQGNERVIAVDVYNGTVFWAKDFPGLKRMNVTRDCSNWAADESHIYLAAGKKLNIVDQQNGEVVSTLAAKDFKNEDSDWGYISASTDHIIGTTTADEAHFINYYGGEGWYDSQTGPLSYKVLSDQLFSISKKDESTVWEYTPQGGIINPTITIRDGAVAFVETRSANKASLQRGRGGDEIYTRAWVVNLDVNTGEKLWESRVKTMPGLTTYFMVGGNGKYLISSSKGGKYDIRCLDAKTGKLAWEQEQKWFHGDHGGHMSKPAIVGNRLMIKPALYNLSTGEEISYNVPKVGHGCAHYALTEQSVFYRGGSVTQFNFDTRNFSKWERLRPDCWLSTIPAEGMILSPEAGGGCSCGNWLETSMVMAPISRAPITIKSLGETSTRDYKKETWGEYTHNCNFDEFVNPVKIELLLKPGVNGQLFYTLDGSEPTKQTTKYTEPFTIEESAKIRAVVYIQKAGKERKFERAQQFYKITPSKDLAENSK